MRKFAFILLLIAQVCYGQSNKVDTIAKLVDESWRMLLEGSPDESINNINNAIRIDSSCYDLFLIRGYHRLWNSQLVGDTLDEIKAMGDFVKYISIKIMSNFSSNCLRDSIIQSHVNYIWSVGDRKNESRELGRFYLRRSYERLILGIKLYCDNTPESKKQACEKWNVAINEYFSYGGAQILIDKFCTK